MRVTVTLFVLFLCVSPGQGIPLKAKRAISIIWPGTKWCGIGNKSDDYDDLGEEEEADICCRAHDHCKKDIKPFTKKYGVFNYTPYPMQDCPCDYTFRKCLRNNKDKTSTAIGIFFFDKLNVKCYADGKVVDIEYKKN